jgi:hypothetical protein
MATKLLRANVAIYAAYPEAFADVTAPTVAELNNEDFVKNISCAIEDSYSLNMTDSDSDDSISICDIGDVQTPTFYNYEATLDGFRDEDLDADGVYNLFFDLFKSPDVPYILVKRIGTPQTDPWVASDIASLYEVITDNPVDLLGDNEMIRLGARFKTTGNVNVNVDVAA